MKKYFIIIVAIITGLISCKKEYDDSVFEIPSEQRVKLVMDAFQQKLLTSPNGWKVTIYPDSGKSGGYSFWMAFDASNRVRMAADWNDTTHKKVESSYRLKQMQQPTLIFDTYNYVHFLADPDAGVNNGEYGAGLNSDFEFIIEADFIKSVLYEGADDPNTISMTGRFHGSKLKMTKTDDPELITKLTESKNEFTAFARGPVYFKRVNFGSTPYDVAVDINKRLISFITYNTAGIATRHTSPYSYSADGGIELGTPLTLGGVKISFLAQLDFMPTGNGALNFTYDGNTSGVIAGVTTPIAIDPNAAITFYQNPPGQAWRLPLGMVVRGDEKLLQIPGYSIALYPSGSIGGIDEDGFGYSIGTSIYCILTFIPSINNNNNLVFSPQFRYGSLPGNGNALLSQFAGYLSNPSGYYVIRTGDASYDLVMVGTAAAWMSFN